jgi:hypothetical protein
MKTPKINNKELNTNQVLKQFSDEELLSEIILRSGSNIGLPTRANCFQCREDF